ncbi:MAG: hypothetical protein LM632_08945 [Armatimonadetes bacterium]|nr:hypothetical protein [Armatimonadota bacterium]
MEQEVGWVEWSSAVLSCIPILGKIGGLALRGVAGVANGKPAISLSLFVAPQA